MKGPLRRITRSLFWRISMIFLLVLVLLTGTYFYIVSDTAIMYFQESSQHLNRPVASRIAKENYLFKDSTGLDDVRDQLFHDVMVLNPSLEVYVVDEEGIILDYNAPDSIIRLEKINLEPVKAFIQDTAKQFFVGDDPRHPELQKPFSAAVVKRGTELKGYVYVVLQSDIYTSVSDRLSGSYMMGLGMQSMVLVLIAAIVISLLLLYLLTRNLNKIVQGVRKFRNGDLEARIDLQDRGELTELAGDFNKMAETIVKHINEIGSVERLRRELIANVSHDLRTPLSAIQGYAETMVMKHDELDKASSIEYAEIILRSTKKIQKLVEDLFELSKLESDLIKVNFETFSIAEMVQDICQKYKILASQHDLRFETNIPMNLPPIQADIALTDRVLQNLIENAIKHTPEGGVITVALKPEKGGMHVSVMDTGIGIPEDDLPFIFDRYRKAANQRKGGTGLGLAIVKKIIEMHNTEIFVKSRLDEGTMFWFSLPIPS